MNTKLTLRLDSELIHKAKKIAHKKGKSVSQLVADYIFMLDKKNKAKQEDLPPLTKSLVGCLKGVKADKADYMKHLEKKYS